MKTEKCKHCGDDLDRWRENLKDWGWPESHLGPDRDQCPACHRVHMEVPDALWACSRCGYKGMMDDFLPGPLMGRDAAVCPLCAADAHVDDGVVMTREEELV